jgi:hypothetical protein
MNKINLKRFAIIMDEKEETTNKNIFCKLIDSISDKLSGTKRPVVEDRVKKLLIECDFSRKNTIYVDEDLNFKTSFFKSGSFYHGKKADNKYFLMRDFDKLVKLLSEYCDEDCTCKRHKGNKFDIEITIETPKPKKLRKVTTYDKITILERWVKIGYEMYRRQFDYKTGDEYIVVDGDVYIIKCDRNGKEYLA